MDKSRRKPGRPIDHRTPSDEVKEKFKTELSKKIVKAVADGFRVFWIDEAHFTTKTKLGLTWLAKGLSTMHKIKSYGKKCTCFGALGDDGLFFHKYYERGNTDKMIDFIQNLYEEYNKILLIMDNASYHKSKKLIEDLESTVTMSKSSTCQHTHQISTPLRWYGRSVESSKLFTPRDITLPSATTQYFVI